MSGAVGKRIVFLNIKHQHDQRGFTLLELLIALSIFSLLSVMAYGGLKTVLDARESSQKVAVRIAAVQLTMLRLSNDLRQAVARPIRDGFGDILPAMRTSQGGEGAVEWTRSGYRNPAPKIFKRSELQRVAYQLSTESDDNGGKKLLRLSWPVLDRVQDTKAYESVMVTGVEELKWRFADQEGQWQTNWPPQSVSSPVFNLIPKAVELTITFSGLGEVRRLVILPRR